MERVESAAQFGKLVSEFRKKWKTVQSNCCLLPGDAKLLTARGKLYVRSYDEVLCFFIKEADCSRLYYYMKTDASLPDTEDWEKPVIFDCIYRGDEEEALQICGAYRWCEKGFAAYKRNRRMEFTSENFLPPADEKEKSKQYPVVALNPEDYEDVLALWKSSLDLYSAPFVDQEEFAAACGRNEMLGIRLSNGKVGAMIVAQFRGRISFMEHLVVSKELRGLGMGRTAFCGGANYLLHHGAKKINGWVDEENSHAIHMYLRMGCEYDGAISRQFKLNE